MRVIRKSNVYPWELVDYPQFRRNGGTGKLWGLDPGGRKEEQEEVIFDREEDRGRRYMVEAQ